MTISKAVVDNELRVATIKALGLDTNEEFTQVSNLSFKTIMTDANGEERLVEVKISVGKVEEERSAYDRLNAEIAAWQEKKDKAEAKKQERAEKAQKDRERRKKIAEEKAKEKEKEQ